MDGQVAEHVTIKSGGSSNSGTKWSEVEAAQVMASGPAEAARVAFEAWHRKHGDGQPDAVFVREPFAEWWHGLRVIGCEEIQKGLVYVGVMV